MEEKEISLRMALDIFFAAAGAGARDVTQASPAAPAAAPASAPAASPILTDAVNATRSFVDELVRQTAVAPVVPDESFRGPNAATRTFRDVSIPFIALVTISVVVIVSIVLYQCCCRKRNGDDDYYDDDEEVDEDLEDAYLLKDSIIVYRGKAESRENLDAGDGDGP